MGVEFEENNFVPRQFDAPTPKLAGYLIRKGWAKDLAGANKLQIGIAILFFALAIIFFIW
ncbi:MAG: hypothetical protein WC767_00675 [Candidatus Paceibacterota bacterium]|jgi:hypothetical protein